MTSEMLKQHISDTALEKEQNRIYRWATVLHWNISYAHFV